MALIISVGSGATIATEQIASLHYGWNKIADGTSGATVGWMIDSGANASGAGHVFLRGNATLSDSKGFIGLVSIAQPITFAGNVTLDAGSKTGIIGNVTLSDPKTFIGSVSVGGIVDSKGFIGLVTIGGISQLTLSDPKGFIGLVSIAQPISTTFSGNVTLDPGSKTAITGNVTLSDPKTFIGSVSVGGLVDSKGFIGLVTIGGMSTVTLSDPKGYIGLVTVGGIGTVTLADPKGFIGLVTVGGIGTVTLADPKGFIGLVTTVPTFQSGYTSLATLISATGVATIVIPPSGQKIFVKSIHVSSLGRAEISFYRANIATATAAVIPWTSLSTTGGFIEFYGESGSQWGLIDDGLTVALNGAATVGIGVNVRFV